MMMVMPATTPHRLRQVLNIRELAALRCAREVRRELIELVRRCRVTGRCGSLGGARQVRRDLLGDLPVLGRVRLLKLLKRAHQLGER